MQNTEGSPPSSTPTGLLCRFKAVYECEVPVVAPRSNGFCSAVGIGLVGNADVIVASDDAKFGLPEVERGALGAPPTCPVGAPAHDARLFYYTAATVDAETLHHFGSVHEVVPRPSSTRPRCGCPHIANKDTRVIVPPRKR